MIPNPELNSQSSRRHRHWYVLGLGGMAVLLLTTVGLASFEKMREASARTK